MSLIKYLTNIFSRSPVVNSASAIGHEFDTTNALSTTGANLLRLSNNATPVFDFSYQGGIDHVNSGASTAAHSQSLNLNWSGSSAKTSSGQYSAVIGQDNTASGSWAMAFGRSNTCSSSWAFAAGFESTASGLGSSVLGGRSNIAQGESSACLNERNYAVGNYSMAGGRYAKATNRCQFAIGAGANTTAGDFQVSTIAAGISTTDATQTTLLAGATNIVIPADTTWAFSALVSARSDEADGNNCAAWELKGLLKRDEAGNTAIVGVVSITDIAADTDAMPWDVDCVANDTNESLDIRVTGEAATNIRWVAKVDISQVGYA